MANPVIKGLHHITLCASGAQEDLDFCTQVLGQRLIKQTVLFDGRYAHYHLYYANANAEVGSVLTTFPYKRVPGRQGSGQISSTAYTAPKGAIKFWKEHLDRHKVEHSGILERFGQSFIRFKHPSGLLMEAIEDPADKRTGWTTDQISSDVSLGGFHGPVLSVREVPEQERFFIEALGFRKTGVGTAGRRRQTSAPETRGFANVPRRHPVVDPIRSRDFACFVCNFVIAYPLDRSLPLRKALRTVNGRISTRALLKFWSFRLAKGNAVCIERREACRGSSDNKEMRVAAVIVAAGRGERAGQSVEGPKQYRKIGGEAVLAHTMRAFLDCPLIDHVVVVIHKEDSALFALALGDHAERVTAVIGGPTRQESTRLGLLALKEKTPDHVLIYDGVRPFISADLLERVIFNLTPHIGVLPVLAVSDTLKAAGPDAMVSATVPRVGLYAAQTPQAFPYLPILDAHNAAFTAGRSDFTDDSAIAEWHGLPVRIVRRISRQHEIDLGKGYRNGR